MKRHKRYYVIYEPTNRVVWFSDKKKICKDYIKAQQHPYEFVIEVEKWK